jgi:hypothetical protein
VEPLVDGVVLASFVPPLVPEVPPLVPELPLEPASLPPLEPASVPVSAGHLLALPSRKSCPRISPPLFATVWRLT